MLHIFILHGNFMQICITCHAIESALTPSNTMILGGSQTAQRLSLPPSYRKSPPSNTTNEWRPPGPVLTDLLKLLDNCLASGHLTFSLAAFYFSQQYYLFQITPPSHDVPKVGPLQTSLFPLFASIFFKSKTISSLLSRTIKPCQKIFNEAAQWSSQMELFNFYTISVSNQVYFTRVFFPPFILWLNKKDGVKKITIFNRKIIF